MIWLKVTVLRVADKSAWFLFIYGNLIEIVQKVINFIYLCKDFKESQKH